MPEPHVPHDYVIRQWLKRERTVPYRLTVANAAWYYDPLTEPYLFERERCPTCDMFAGSCKQVEPRQGTQMGRLIVRNGRVFTSTFHRFPRYDMCGMWEGQFGYGECIGKETQGQYAIGHLRREIEATTGWHRDRVILDSATSHVAVDDVQAVFMTAYRTWVGYLDPFGHGLGHWDVAMRFKLTLPADAVIVAAQLYWRRAAVQAASCHVRLMLLDRDSMAPFSNVEDDPNNPARNNPNGPQRINVHGGDNNQFEIALSNGGGGGMSYFTIPHSDAADGAEKIACMVREFICRPGYSSMGSYMGVVLASDQDLNETYQNSLYPLAWSASGHGPVLLINWHEHNAPPMEIKARSPKLEAYLRLTETNTPVPPEGTNPEYGEGIDAGGTIGQSGAQKFPDQAWANTYRYLVLTHVKPLLSWWNADEYNEPPYPQDAHERFALDDCRTYEIPCVSRRPPFRYLSLGVQQFPQVKAGLRAMVGYSTGSAHNGLLPVYAGGCQLGGHYYTGLDENTWRFYRGQTQPHRIVWETDLEHRGWFIEYTAYIRAWYVQDALYEGACDPDVDIGLPDSCEFRWNCWYEVEIRISIDPRADADDPAFQAWILTHKAGFGGCVTPRYSHCNDVLRGCGAGIGHAMGDCLYPPEACQDAMGENGLAYADETKYAPCKYEDDEYSWWYRPEVLSNHPETPRDGPRIPAYPEYGLPHETKFVRKLDLDGDATEDVYDWAMIVFMTTTPWLLSADDGAPEIVNERHRIEIVDPARCDGPPASGTFRLGWGAEDMWWTAHIPHDATADQVRQAFEWTNYIGADNVSVVGPDGGPWEVEYVNDLAGQDVLLPELKFCNIEDESGCAFTVRVYSLQEGGGAGN